MVLSILLRIAVWRANPQDLPASQVLVAIALLAHFLADVAILAGDLPFGAALQASALDTGLLIVLTAAWLRVRNLQPRLMQTLTALAGVNVLLMLALHLLVTLTHGWLAPTVFVLPYVAWYLAVHTHVLRHALSFSTGPALAVSFLYLMMSITVGAMFGPPVPQEI
jgi:hypothetical protein